uniref:NADH dehydrogenase subunit 2 n=1 Tax=Chlorokybus atmophyticus TaxID=3144 RepID=A6YEC4_CHLAT|nr:NADH dehydrogenase subunit 2 [Chlorokybus atmophyticus]ABO15102.1 NADH dehydrogenase subunit 2 [Chlorokybus atmophyticus]
MNLSFIDLFENDLKGVFPEIFLITGTIILLVYGVIYTTERRVLSKRNIATPILIRNISWLGLYSLVLSFLLTINTPFLNGVIFYNSLVLDNFTYYLKLIIFIATFSTILFSIDYLREEKLNSFEYIILILFSTCSILLMVSSYDLIALYLAIEFQSLSFYVIAASKRNSEFSTEAGLKYFLLGAFSSGILLFGCSMIYGFTGVTNLEELAKILTSLPEAPWITETGLFIGILFLAVGFLFKLTAAPFHMWAPDVYEGSPTSVTAFFSLAPKIAILGALSRVFFYSFYDLILPWQKIFIVCSIASMILGALAAVFQKKIKRLLAYSSIGHVGYMLIGLSCGTIEGVQALFLYLIIYIAMTINIFSLLLALQKIGRGGKERRLKYIADLRGLAHTNPILALTLTAVLFSIAGIPPLAGFFGKFYLFFTALSASLYLLAVIGVVTSVISCFYYIRLVKIMYFEKINTWPLWGSIKRENSLLLAITFFFILFLGIYPSPFFLVTHQMALALSF